MLPKGRYYWHVAPAAEETGRFSASSSVDSTPVPSPNPTPTPTAKAAPEDKPDRPGVAVRSGWRVVSASMLDPVVVGRVQGSALILIAADKKGGVFAFDGITGEPRWSRGASLLKGREGPFALPVIGNSARVARLLIVTSKGISALDLTSGAVAWEKEVQGAPISFAPVDFSGHGDSDFVVITNSPSTAIVLDGTTGEVISQTRLFGPVTIKPVQYDFGADHGYVLCEGGGLVDVRNRKGERLRFAKLDVETSTAPILVRNGNEVLLLVGTEKGVVALDAASLKPRWRVDTPGDPPTGNLTAADFDSNKIVDVAMITKSGEIVIIDSSIGKIRWRAKGAERANSATFADVNSDGRPDILLPNNSGSAMGLSGSDGQLLFDAADDPDSPLRTVVGTGRLDLLTIKGPAGTGTWLFLSDRTGPGLRALLIGKPISGMANR